MVILVFTVVLAVVGAETMTNLLQEETRTSKCMLTAVIINREVDNE